MNILLVCIIFHKTTFISTLYISSIFDLKTLEQYGSTLADVTYCAVLTFEHNFSFPFQLRKSFSISQRRTLFRFCFFSALKIQKLYIIPGSSPR